MKCTLLRGRPRTFEAWIVEVENDIMLYTFSSRKLALRFMRLLHCCDYDAMTAYKITLGYTVEGAK